GALPARESVAISLINIILPYLHIAGGYRRLLYNKVKETDAQLYVSMENRMGCGVGACLVCSCKTSGGNKKVCKDGPVFKAEEVFADEQ
ncbi:MAG: hypothetical protein J6B76_02845, partial [Peptococcaceae bacterium]|nr:hypothetical protein [Peptococcaceae bacterium]